MALVAASCTWPAFAPLTARADAPDEADGRWWAPQDGRPLAPQLEYANDHGIGGVLFDGGVLDTTREAFFAPLGSNGRACVSCHQPADAMGLSAASIRERWETTAGRDPLFAPIDGADCPTAPAGIAGGHSLMLSRGLVRVARPWPPRDAYGRRVEPEFDLEVVSDPTACNVDPAYGLQSRTPSVSVYRRPRAVANLRAAERAGTLMSDARAPSLEFQAADAAQTHLQRAAPLSVETMASILRFERGAHAAQSRDVRGDPLDAAGAHGGPQRLAHPDATASRRRDLGAAYAAWASGGTPPATDAALGAYRASVARGAALFSTRRFDLDGTAGLPPGVGPRGSCASCHDEPVSGGSRAGLETDIGTANLPHATDSPGLPLFKLTCRPGRLPHETLGREVLTHDPGLALTTGRCVDIGRMVPQSLRGLAARPPYFTNGSAATLRDVVDFYERRYRIGFTDAEKVDLATFLGAL